MSSVEPQILIFQMKKYYNMNGKPLFQFSPGTMRKLESDKSGNLSRQSEESIERFHVEKEMKLISAIIFSVYTRYVLCCHNY